MATKRRRNTTLRATKKKLKGKKGNFGPKAKVPKSFMDLYRGNPGATTSGFVKCKAVKIVRNHKGQAVSVKIKT